MYSRGFTLIEILIAIFISTILLGVLYTSFFQIINARDKVEYELEMLHEARTIFNRIRKDLSNAFPRDVVIPEESSDGEQQIYEQQYSYFTGTVINDNNELTFSSLARDPSPETIESDQVQISYYLVEIDDSERERYALVRSENPWFGNQDGGIAYPISERVLSFRLNFITEEYLNAQNPEPIREWNAALLGAYPKAVEIEVTLINHEGESVTYNSMIYIPVSG